MSETLYGQALERWAVVRFTAVGFHCWPDAPARRDYLQARHRHLFEIEVRVQVTHNEREIEFHDLLDYCKLHYQGGEMDAKSCETMGEELAKKILDRYPGRGLQISVFEDGEVGAIIRCLPL